MTMISIITYTRTKFCVCFTKINTNFFSDGPKLLLKPKVFPSPNTKKLFLRISAWDDELLSTSIINYYNIYSIAIAKTPFTFSVKCYSIATTYILFFITTFYYISCFKQFFNVKFLSGILSQASNSKTI